MLLQLRVKILMRLRLYGMQFYSRPTSVADPGSGAFLLQGSGSGMHFFRISDPYDFPNSRYLQDFTFKNDEKQEKLNFV
jgi:hypothetical protein